MTRKNHPLVSIITVVSNNKDTIEYAIKSVLNQDYRETEYIVIDGGSTDGTVVIIKKYENRIAYWVSEADNGIYDAMNKGIKAATGDIIGFLNSDDVYTDDEVINTVVEAISEKDVDSCYGDLVYVDKNDKIVRLWKSKNFSKERFKRGWMPPHPTFFVKKWVYEKYENFNLDFPIAADYELMLRFLYKFRISTAYIPEVLIKMRIGGKSNESIFNIIKANIECYKAWRVNNLRPNPFILILKPASKVFQYFK